MPELYHEDMMAILQRRQQALNRVLNTVWDLQRHGDIYQTSERNNLVATVKVAIGVEADDYQGNPTPVRQERA